ADATVLALGGGSWARLGSDGAWWPTLDALDVELAPLRPSNCGFEVEGRPGGTRSGWSDHFRSRCAGQALKSVALEIRAGDAPAWWRQVGEMVVSDYGVEGSLVYAASSRLRAAIDANGRAAFSIDLLPLRDLAWLEQELARPRGARSLSTHLKTRLGLFGVKAALLHEREAAIHTLSPAQLAALIKAVPMRATAARPLDEAISSAGGVRFEALDANAMLNVRAGVFCAGEMLDWEAPTGGYLLNACFASGRLAGRGALRWLANAQPLATRTNASRGTANP
ncbi:MAG: TIGR03862 family flavoprotein, partial [Rubrivivax sp.]